MIAKYNPGLVASKHGSRLVTVPLAFKGLRITKNRTGSITTPSNPKGLRIARHDLRPAAGSMAKSLSLYYTFGLRG